MPQYLPLDGEVVLLDVRQADILVEPGDGNGENETVCPSRDGERIAAGVGEGIDEVGRSEQRDVGLERLAVTVELGEIGIAHGIKNAVAGADGGLAVAKGIDDNAGARRKVVVIDPFGD